MKFIRILIIEDNKADLNLVTIMLSRYFQPDHIFNAMNLSDGIKKVNSVNPDIILLDLNLPDSFGIETIIRLNRENKNLPVVVLTGNCDIHFGVATLNNGAQDYLVKDQINEESLYKSILYAMERKRNEQVLKDNSEFYRVLFQNNQVITLLIDPDTGEIVDANNAACNFYRYLPEEIKKVKIQQLSSMPEKEIFRQMHMARTRQLMNFRFRHRRSDGEFREVEVSSEPVVVQGKELLYSTVKDITEKQRADEERKIQELKSQAANNLLRKLVKHTVANNISTSHFMKIIAKEAAEELEIDRVSIWFSSTDTTHYRQEAVYPEMGFPGDEKQNDFIQRTSGLFSGELLSGRCIVINREACPDNPDIDIEIENQDKTQCRKVISVLIIPILFEGEFIGIIFCENCSRMRWWNEEEKFFASAGDLIAISKENEIRQLKENKLKGIVRKTRQEFILLNSLLKESRETQRIILDSIPDMAWMKDKEGRFIAVNNTVAAMCGIAKEEISGKTDFDLWDLETAEGFHDGDRKVIESGKELVIEEWISDRNGNKKLFQSRKIPIFNQDGAVIGTVGIAHDITTLRRSSEKLKKENRILEEMVYERTKELEVIADNLREEINERIKVESQLRKLSVAVEQSPISIIITDIEGNIEYANSKFTEISGYTFEEVKGKNPGIFKSGSTPAALYSDLWKKLNNGEIWNGELLNKKKNGELYWEHAVISPIKSDKATVTHYVGLKTDISNRKIAEKQLIESEERFRTIFENSPIGINISVNGRTMLCNASFIRMLGYSNTGELSGRPIIESVAPEWRTYFLNYLLKKAKGEAIEDTFNYNALKANGSEFPVRVTVAELFLPEGHALMGFYTDETERKQKENQIVNSLREKEVLIKEIHHRVKNNLQIISSLLNLQIDKLHDPLLLEAFNVSKSRIKAMALIHERLYHSKDLSVINLNDYFTDLVHYLKNTYITDSRLIEFSLSFREIFLSIDMAIPCGLIINELVTNALKYAFTGRKEGQVALSADLHEGKEVVMRVADNGKGFAPGFNIKNSSTLGLQLVYSLVEQINGSIEMENHTGVKFTIRFEI